MELALVAFFAGALTVAAPCILPLLPVVVGGSLTTTKDTSKPWLQPLVIALSLASSVFAFTLLLKATSAFLGVPQSVWSVIAGGTVTLLGLGMLFPHAWAWLMSKTNIHESSNAWLGNSYRHSGHGRNILIGAALGPVFNSCSPTYALLVAVTLPASLLQGTIYIGLYSLGLAMTLLIIAIFGQKVIQKIGWASNQRGVFRRSIGVLFVIVGLTVLTGLDRSFQTFVLENGWYDPIMRLENSLRLPR